MVKEDAPELLRQELSSTQWKPQTLGLSGVTYGYQPAERRWRLTRRCLEVLAEFRNPVGIVTKNYLVTRDLDYLQELALRQTQRLALWQPHAGRGHLCGPDLPNVPCGVPQSRNRGGRSRVVHHELSPAAGIATDAGALASV